MSPAAGPAPGAGGDAATAAVAATAGAPAAAAAERARAEAWVRGFARAVEAAAEDLTALDRRSGDGDFGTNLRSAVRRATAALDASPAPPDADGVLGALSDAFLHTGGTSGPLFGMTFRALRRAAADAGLDRTATLADGAREGVATVRRLGGAAPGDKTMVDALQPAADALTAAADRGDDPATALRAAAAAADAGAAATESLRARRGRASYVGEVAVGVRDPGAVAVGMFYAAGADAFGAGR